MCVSPRFFPSPEMAASKSVEAHFMAIHAALMRIGSMLKEESKYWLDKNRSKTADSVDKFQVSVLILIFFAKEKDIKSLIHGISELDFYISGLRSCFRGTENAASKRQQVSKHWCTVMAGILEIVDDNQVRDSLEKCNFPLSVIKKVLCIEAAKAGKIGCDCPCTCTCDKEEGEENDNRQYEDEDVDVIPDLIDLD